MGVEPLCFDYFHLGPQMKVARQPGETGGLQQAEQNLAERIHGR
jgi:hypothetical protein